MPNRPRCTQVLVALCFWVTTAGTLAAQAPPVPEDSAAFATIARYLKSQYSSKNLTIVVTPYRIMDLALAIEDKLEEEQVNERLLDSRRKVLSDLRILLTSKRMPSKCLGALVPRAYPTDELCPRTDSVAVLVGLAHSRGSAESIVRIAVATFTPTGSSTEFQDVVLALDSKGWWTIRDVHHLYYIE